MDEAVKKTILVLAASLGLAALPAAAQSSRSFDPTRPPAGIDRLAPDAGASAEPRLQSVLIAPGPGGRHVAVIDGDTVRLGDTWRGARVASMRRNEVVLVRGAQRQVLRMDAAADTVAGMTPAAR